MKYLSSIICLFFTLGAWGNLQAESLHQAVDKTLYTHPELRQLESEREAIEQTVKQAHGEYLPSVDLEGGYGKEHSDNPATRAAGKGNVTFTRSEGGIRLRQLLFDGGNVIHTTRAREYDVDRADELVKESEQNLAFRAISAYIDVLRRKDLIFIRSSSVTAHKDILGKVKERFQSGAGRKSEVTLVEGRTALAQSQLDQQQGLRKNARDIYQAVVGHSPKSAEMRLPRLPQNLPKSREQAVSIALEHNPTLAAISAELDAALETIGAAKAAFLPNFYVDLGYRNDNNLDGVKGKNEEALAMVRAEYNLFRGGSDKAAVNEAIKRSAAARFDKDRIVRTVVQDTEVSWNDWVTTKKRAISLRKHKDESHNVFLAYVEQFSLGQRTLFDLLNAQVEYFNASAAYTDNQYNIQRNTYRLLESMGTLVDVLGIYREAS